MNAIIRVISITLTLICAVPQDQAMAETYEVAGRSAPLYFSDDSVSVPIKSSKQSPGGGNVDTEALETHLITEKVSKSRLYPQRYVWVLKVTNKKPVHIRFSVLLKYLDEHNFAIKKDGINYLAMPPKSTKKFYGATMLKPDHLELIQQVEAEITRMDVIQNPFDPVRITYSFNGRFTVKNFDSKPHKFKAKYCGDKYPDREGFCYDERRLRNEYLAPQESKEFEGEAPIIWLTK